MCPRALRVRGPCQAGADRSAYTANHDDGEVGNDGVQPNDPHVSVHIQSFGTPQAKAGPAPRVILVNFEFTPSDLLSPGFGVGACLYFVISQS